MASSCSEMVFWLFLRLMKELLWFSCSNDMWLGWYMAVFSVVELSSTAPLGRRSDYMEFWLDS